MNINQLAVRVAKREGKKKSLSIAQIKEVMRCLKDETNENFESWVAWTYYRPDNVLKAVKKLMGHNKKPAKQFKKASGK